MDDEANETDPGLAISKREHGSGSQEVRGEWGDGTQKDICSVSKSSGYHRMTLCLTKRNKHLPHGSAIPLWGLYPFPNECIIHKKTHKNLIKASFCSPNMEMARRFIKKNGQAMYIYKIKINKPTDTCCINTWKFADESLNHTELFWKEGTVNDFICMKF
jgi:hypothetical protein